MVAVVTGDRGVCRSLFVGGGRDRLQESARFVPVPHEVAVPVYVGVVQGDAVFHGEVALDPAPLSGSEDAVVYQKFEGTALKRLVVEV